MKDKDLEFGNFKVGPFKINVAPTVFDNRPADIIPFFEVMISEERTLRDEKGSPTYPFYIHLVEDTRFGLFSDFGKFNLKIRAEGTVEYNTYIDRKHLNQPTWKLSRGTLCEIFEKAQKSKRRTMADVRKELEKINEP